MTETVGAVLIDCGRVLLGSRVAHKSFAGCWDIIGGHIEPGETHWSALCRELTEELGIKGIRGDHIRTLTVLDPPDHPSILHVYSVTLWKGEPVVQNDEHTEIRWFELEQAECLSNLATPQYREIFELLRDASLNLNGN